jgi:hypothetical protein
MDVRRAGGIVRAVETDAEAAIRNLMTQAR